MAGKNVSFFKGFLTVAILAVIIFCVLFFFFPDVSYKYFGTAFDSTRAVEDIFASVLYKADYMSREEMEKISAYISSADGKAFIHSLSSAVTSGKDALSSFVSSESFSSFREKMSEILSPESLEKLSKAINDTASSFLGK